MRFIAKNKSFCVGLSTSTTLNNPEYIHKLQTVIHGATYFSVRDYYSLNVLKQAGISTNNVRIINDIVYANDKLLSAVQNRKIQEHSETVHIGVVYIVAEETKEAFQELIASIRREMEQQNKKYLISLISIL